ncbi:adenine phosphoribosyltransferase 3-like, partial [Capsicum annuum]|uniref:adenine phosphoribosyltransferase 3-like n=1 Tax=Capsicum annuum TaxID=4072 RepID=UPI001FB09A49
KLFAKQRDQGFQRVKPIIVDPGLYATQKADVFCITQRRSVPTGFKLFTGIESRGFIFGPPIALAIGAKFVPSRKPKKLRGTGANSLYGTSADQITAANIAKECTSSFESRLESSSHLDKSS